MFFGLSQILALEYIEIKKIVNDERYRIEQELLSRKNNKKDWLKILFAPFVYIYNFILSFRDMLNYIAGVFISYITVISNKIKNYSNYAKIEKGASNNYIVQIGNVNINQDATPEESIVIDSKEEVVKKIIELIESGKQFDFGNEKANKLFIKAQEINNDKNTSNYDKKNQVQFYAALIVGILLYSTTFKGGISSISILGITIVVGIRACMPSYNDEVKDTLYSDDESKEKQELVANDTVKSKDSDTTIITENQANNNEVLIEEPEQYKLVVPEWFEPDYECTLLSSMGKRQEKFINKLDYVDHASQDYFIDFFDKNYYIHVVGYKDIKQAAFQMHHINERTNFQAKILESFTERGLLYFVVIGKFKGFEAKEMSRLIKEWEGKCFSNSVQIGCYFNGC